MWLTPSSLNMTVSQSTCGHAARLSPKRQCCCLRPDTRALDAKNQETCTECLPPGERRGRNGQRSTGQQPTDQGSCKAAGTGAAPLPTHPHGPHFPGTLGHRSLKMTGNFFRVSAILERAKCRWPRQNRGRHGGVWGWQAGGMARPTSHHSLLSASQVHTAGRCPSRAAGLREDILGHANRHNISKD